jgi:hypothetical protein
MKGGLIILNWLLSLMGLAIEEPVLATILGFTWFCISSWLLIHAQNKGWIDAFWESKVGKFFDTEKNP